MHCKKLVLFFLICAVAIGCARPIPKGFDEASSWNEVVGEETDQRRIASLKLVGEGRRFLSQQKYARATHRFSSAIEIDAKNPYAYFFFGQARARKGKHAEAVELFGRASQLLAQNEEWKAEALVRRGESQEQLRRFSSARVSYEAALNLDRDHVRAQDGLERMKEQEP